MAAELYHQPFFCTNEIKSDIFYFFADGLYAGFCTNFQTSCCYCR